MSERPDLDKSLDSKTFRSYYYLKEELTAFCLLRKAPGLFQGEDWPRVFL